MKNTRKVLALLVAAIMMVASAAVFADGVGLGDGAVESTNEVVRIVKEIKAYNPATCTVNEPTQTYNYAITAGTADVVITDANGVQANTKAGVLTGVAMTSETNSTAGTTTSLTYAPTAGTLNAGPDGVANTKWVDIDFSGVVFGAAGVYRYVITESGATYGTNGVVEGDTGHVRYLDVYVKDSATMTDGSLASDWEIYGYALFTSDVSTVGTATEKTSGYTTDDGTLADKYYTFNFSLTKDVQNDSYIESTHHEFPFTVTLTNSTVTADVLPIMTLSANATQTDLSAGAIAGTWNPTIADGATVTYVGIPAGTTITIYETNDVTGATYQVSSTGADTDITAANVLPGDDSGTATISAGATAGQAATANKNVTVVNNLQTISPTGVMLRIAPFVAIFAIAAVILVVALRRRSALND